MTVTFVTLAPAEDAPGKPADDWMFAANAGPFWSRLTRLAIGVFGLKNAIQLAVISATALPAVEGEELDGAAAADVVLALGLGVELELEPLLPHAAMLAPRAQVSSMISGLEYRVFTQTFSSFPM